jgi:type I restriction enzyme S subunit
MEGSGTVFANATRSQLERLAIPWFNAESRQAIAHILSSLDDKIELNRRMNQTLEDICRALFKFWFVNFGPVRAKQEGRWKKGESLPGMPANMWDLWPSEFEESEIGEIPKGWKPVSLTEIASLLTGGTPSTAEPAYWNGGIPWVSGKDVSAAKGGFIIQTERTITGEGVENSATALLPARTVVITARGTVGALGVIASDMCISQTNYGLKALDGIGDNFLLFTVGNAIDQLQRASYGTIFDTITTRNLQATIVVLPPEPLRSEFELRTHFLMERVLLKLHEGKTLASTRDALLPKLLSGEIRVPVDEGK